jgi:hypothetical protein
LTSPFGGTVEAIVFTCLNGAMYAVWGVTVVLVVVVAGVALAAAVELLLLLELPHPASAKPASAIAAMGVFLIGLLLGL